MNTDFSRLKRRFSSLVLVITGLALFLLAVRASGQTAGTGQSSSVNPLLEPTPITVEALNLRFHPPKGASTIAESANGAIMVTLRDDPREPTWTMRVQTMKSTLPDPSPKAQIDDLLKELDLSKSQYRVISNEAHAAAKLPGQLCYIERTTAEGQNVVTGWLVLPLAKAEFMVFAMQTVPESFSLLRGVWEASFATLDLRTQEQVSAARNARMVLGQEFLASLTPERLRSLVGQKQWSRIYKPSGGAAGAMEVGCALIEVLAAKRGALNPNKDEAKYNSAEREEGLMVRMQGRYVLDAAKKIFYDSIALYWVSWDQTSEAWSARGTQRQGDAESSEAETGLRPPPSSGQPAPTLSVIKTTQTAPPVSNEWDVPEVYLSQALGWVVGRLMPRDVTEPKEYAWYYYVPSNVKPKVYQRIDKWERLNDGTYTLTTALSPESPPYTTSYDKNGEFARRVSGDGSVTVPIELEELRRIWKAKGLPISANDR